MTHKIRGVRAEEYAYYVYKLRPNVGLETWIWRQIVTSQTMHTKYKWPPHATDENPPWKFSAYATEPKRYELRNSYLANVNFLSETRAFWTWHTSQDLTPEMSITGKWIDLTSGELHDNLNVTFYFYTAHHQRLQFWRWKQEKQRCISHPIVLACAKNSVVCVMQFRSMLRYGTIGFAGKPTARLN